MTPFNYILPCQWPSSVIQDHCFAMLATKPSLFRRMLSVSPRLPLQRHISYEILHHNISDLLGLSRKVFVHQSASFQCPHTTSAVLYLVHYVCDFVLFCFHIASEVFEYIFRRIAPILLAKPLLNKLSLDEEVGLVLDGQLLKKLETQFLGVIA